MKTLKMKRTSFSVFRFPVQLDLGDGTERSDTGSFNSWVLRSGFVGISKVTSLVIRTPDFSSSKNVLITISNLTSLFHRYGYVYSYLYI